MLERDTLSAAIKNAIDSLPPQAAIDSIKTAVIKELVALDPEVEPRSTPFFNHSIAPDLVLTWKEPGRGRKTQREVYLRPDLAAVVASGELPVFAAEPAPHGGARPVVLGLEPIANAELTDEVAAAVTGPDVLVTNAPALDSILRIDDSEPISPLSLDPPMILEVERVGE